MRQPRNHIPENKPHPLPIYSSIIHKQKAYRSVSRCKDFSPRTGKPPPFGREARPTTAKSLQRNRLIDCRPPYLHDARCRTRFFAQQRPCLFAQQSQKTASHLPSVGRLALQRGVCWMLACHVAIVKRKGGQSFSPSVLLSVFCGLSEDAFVIGGILV